MDEINRLWELWETHMQVELLDEIVDQYDKVLDDTAPVELYAEREYANMLRKGAVNV